MVALIPHVVLYGALAFLASSTAISIKRGTCEMVRSLRRTGLSPKVREVRGKL